MARYRQRSAPLRTHQKNPRRRREPSNGKFLLVTIVQSALCMTMLLAAFAASRFWGMTQLKEAYRTLLSEETQAVAVFSSSWQEPSWAEGIGLRLNKMVRGVWESLRIRLDPNEGGRGGGATLPEHVLQEDVVLSARPILPVEGRVTSPYGPREHPLAGGEDFHTGLDLAAPSGTPIQAVLPGVVAEVGVSPVYGNYIRMNHGGFETRYCHCEAVAVREGWKLRQGETIGWVGSTGWSTGPHLHFELLVDGKAADPVAAAGWNLS